jgi:hypothetical protein
MWRKWLHWRGPCHASHAPIRSEWRLPPACAVGSEHTHTTRSH